MDNPLWEFSLRIYALDGVAPTCLSLQEQFGLDVNLLLYAAWLAHADRELTSNHLAELDALVADWRSNVTRPLRALRRQLRAYPPAASTVEELSSLELSAERHQQDMMYAYTRQARTLPQADLPLRDNLVRVAQFTSATDQCWLPTIDHLATLLPR